MVGMKPGPEMVEVKGEPEEPMEEPQTGQSEDPPETETVKKSKLMCMLCKKFLSNNSNLKKHVKQMHPTEDPYYLNSLSRRTQSQTKLCVVCGKNFSRAANLKRHTERVHDSATEKHIKLEAIRKERRIPQNQKCALCSFCADRKTMLDHYDTKHDIDIETDDMWFNTIEEFFNWKDAYELETNSLFVQTYNTIRDGKMYRGFQCHRSGVFLSNSKGQRRLKIKGSKKINGMCPAFIWLKKVDSQYSLHIVKTHVGHNNEIGHLNLKKSERESIAEKIARNIPFDDILEEFHKSLSKSKLKRSHLLTRKDLHNIKAKMIATSSNFRKPVIADETESAENRDMQDNFEDDIMNISEDENKELNEELTKAKVVDVEKTKEKVFKNLAELIKKVSGMDYNELIAVENGISTIRPTIQAVKSSKPVVIRKIKFVRNKNIASPTKLITIKKENADIH